MTETVFYMSSDCCDCFCQTTFPKFIIDHRKVFSKCLRTNCTLKRFTCQHAFHRVDIHHRRILVHAGCFRSKFRIIADTCVRDLIRLFSQGITNINHCIIHFLVRYRLLCIQSPYRSRSIFSCIRYCIIRRYRKSRRFQRLNFLIQICGFLFQDLYPCHKL